MSVPPPILAYAALKPRNTLRIWIGIILILWSVFDLFWGVILCVGGLIIINISPPHDVAIASLMAIIASILILTYAGLAIFWGIAVLKHRPNAARSARNWTLCGEILCWTGFLIPLTVCALDSYPRSTGDEFRAQIAISFAALLIPAAVTVTRCLLTRLARAAPAQPST